jgi:serine/threonine protein kinase
MKPTPAIQCPKCSAQNLPDSRFCSSCGLAFSSSSQMPTMGVPEAGSPGPVETPHVARIISSDSIPAGGFTPGTILADRYRIIGLLGRGGMGEVYRADDLKLGQPVALKFLPPKLAEDPVRRERFFAEVRITRQLSHPNICRVYDIAEIDGRHFLSMEFIDGEDLASLMKRIGHLSNEKALDIARQLVAGLSVAHERGVLHRDLKPANIMLDGHGRVRITDFGLAIAVGDESQAEEIAGTPAYMAPEQLAGKGATVRSDMYSLGLVLYEIYTGKKAFAAATLAELREQKETQTPRAPSELREGIDPVVERVIQRCMEKDPNLRPASVAQLAQALPGGDPLAAAIAAGETPSPEMVAASGSTEGLKPWIAWAFLAFIILGIAVHATSQLSILRYVPIEKSPEVLAQTARDILSDAGYTDTPSDNAFGLLDTSTAYLDYVEKTDRSPKRFEKMPALAIQFWYRQSPFLLIHKGPALGVKPSDPPFINDGESIVWLDSRGHLTGLRVIPIKADRLSDAAWQPDWSVLFTAAGLDQNKFTEQVESQVIPPVHTDTQVAWTGTLPDFPSTAIRIEAASWQGKPVLWRMVVPSWNSYSTASLPSGQSSPGKRNIAITILSGAMLVLLFVAGPLFFARRNLRMGRGDRGGAARLALLVVGLQGVLWLFGEHHVLSSQEFSLFLNSVAYWLLIAGWLWLLYIALEPFARRRWPAALVGWNRLLAGNYRDPLVGRDLLVGCFASASVIMLTTLFRPVIGLFSGPRPQQRPFLFEMLSLFCGPHMIVAGILSALVEGIFYTLAAAFIVSVMRILLRNTWVAVIVPCVLLPLLTIISGNFGATILLAVFLPFLFFVFIRFGLLALMAFTFFLMFAVYFPKTIQAGWYFGVVLTGFALRIAFVLYAFRTSFGARPIFGTPRLDE